MVRRPDLGYSDEGLDFADPDSFARQRRPFGEARTFPRAAYRSMQFLYLEDEALWTRAWIPVGTVHEIPGEGDLLPFTLGYHGVHLQRMSGGTFEGRFNLAQHGGCRVVPTQCQQGKRTSCSFTSCGYSRDRGPMPAGEGHDDQRTMYQYVGLRPERLHPVQVARRGALLFLNIDPDPRQEPPAETMLPPLVSRPDATRVHGEWIEFEANWKFAGEALAAVDTVTDATDEGLRGMRETDDGSQLDIRWVFPNAVILSTRIDACVVVLQHTAIGQTMFRVEILSDRPMTEDRLAFWRGELSTAGARAKRAQAKIPTKAALDPADPAVLMPIQEDPAAWWFQNRLIDRFATMPRVESDIPIFRNVENYLI